MVKIKTFSNKIVAENEFKQLVVDFVNEGESILGYTRTVSIYRALTTGDTVHIALNFIENSDPWGSLERGRVGEMTKLTIAPNLYVFTCKDYVLHKNGIQYTRPTEDIIIRTSDGNMVKAYYPIMLVETAQDGTPIDITKDGVTKILLNVGLMG